MTFTFTAIIFSLAALISVTCATYIFLQARANIGLNAEREEFAKAHRIVMDMALMYQMPATEAKFKRLEEVRADVQAYYEQAISPKPDSRESAGNVIYAFDRTKYKTNVSD